MPPAVVFLWLGFAFLGIVGLFHAAYSSGRHYYVGFGVAALSAAGIASILAITIFS